MGYIRFLMSAAISMININTIAILENLRCCSLVRTFPLRSVTLTTMKRTINKTTRIEIKFMLQALKRADKLLVNVG